MIVFKCKMCGGDLNLDKGTSIAECEYCGTRQTVPNADNEKKLALFSRAGRLLRACEFDKAAVVFESIVTDFPEEAEAFWGLVLCKYGIEYVDDPTTGKKIPTCHRSSFASVMDDENFDQACENADAAARRLYRDEAKAIEELRKHIIEVSGKEAPYDIFICYKETDENGDRTLDSVLAQDIYDALTEKGYRVFFSRVTLEDKLGQEYEPYIFAALNSAKVMLAIGTDYDYYNAVWVKNEWSRFLQLIASGQKKTLIPCYKGIDAYDMPKEFAKLQAQDLGKVGAMQDLLRGVDKLLGKGAETAKNATSENKSAVTNVDALLKRVAMLLKDEEWEHAHKLCEQILNTDPENAQAYVYELMGEMEVSDRDDLAYCSTSLSGNKNYQKALRFGDEELKSALNSYNAAIRDRENERSYEKAEREFAKGEYSSAIAILDKLGNYRDAAEKLEKAQFALESYNYNIATKVLALGNYGGAIVAFSKLKQTKNVEAKLRLARSKWMQPHGAAIATGGYHSVALKSNGTVLDVGDVYDGRCDISNLKDIAAVAAASNYAVFLKSDGTVAAVEEGKTYEQRSVPEWEGIVAVAASFSCAVGIKSDGTVIVNGSNDCSEWKDIVAIDAGGVQKIIGLKSDGTVVVAGDIMLYLNSKYWENIIDIAAGSNHVVGLKSDGTVVAVGDNKEGQCNVSGWRDIVDVAASGEHTLGLKSDGTVLIAGEAKDRLRNVTRWSDIVAIATSGRNVLGLKSDGSVVGAGWNLRGETDVSAWNDIRVLNLQKEAYDAACAEINRQIQDEVSAAIAPIDDMYNEKLQKLKEEIDAAVNAANRQRGDIQQQISDLRRQQSSLGFFKGKERKEMQTRIDEALSRQDKVATQQQIQRNYQPQIDQIHAEKQAAVDQLKKEIQAKYTMPKPEDFA